MANNLGSLTKVARGATLLFVQGFLSFLIGLIYFMVMARFFAPAEMGVFIILTFILSLAQITTTFAFSSAAPKFIAQHIAEKQQEKASNVIFLILRVSVTASLLFSVIVFFMAEPLSNLFFGASSWVTHFQLTAVASFFTVLYIVTLSFVQGLQKMGRVAALGLIFVTSQAILGIFLLYHGYGLIGVLYGWIFGYALASFLGLIMTTRQVKIRRQTYPFKPLLSFTLPLYLSGLLGFALSWVDQLFVLPFQGVADVGIYGFMVRASGIPALITTSVFTVLLPQLSELYVLQGEEGLKDSFFMTSRYAVMVGFPLITGLVVLARPSLVLFGGETYAVATLPLIILSLATLPITAGVAIGPTFMALNRTRTYSMGIAVSIICNTILSYFLLANVDAGIFGAALARLISQCVMVGLGFMLLRKIVAVKFDREMILKAGLSTTIMAVALVFFDMLRLRLSSGGQLLVFRLHLLPVYVVFGGFVYIASIILVRGIKKHDIELFSMYMPNRLKPIINWLGRIARVEK